jgi:HlyD family secretion protein
MKKYFKFIILAIVILIFIGTFVFLYKKSRPQKTLYNEVNPVVATISKTTIVTGKIEPRNEVNIKPQISGIISVLYKEAGQSVEKNEVIAKVKVIPDMQSLSSAQNRVQLAKVNLAQAKTNYEREKALYDKNLVSADEYDQIKQALSQAQTEYNGAEDQLEVIRDGVSKSNASQSSTLIRSTVTGLILDVPVKVGNSVILSNTFNDGTTIATVADMNDLIFDGNIDETEVGNLSVGMPVKITIGALQNVTFDAALEFISPKATTSNGANQFEIKAAVKVPVGSNQIRSGYSANAEIVLQQADSVLSVPESVLSFSGDSTFVYVSDGKGVYTKRAITTGLSDGVNIEVKKGITTKDKLRGTAIVDTKKSDMKDAKKGGD